MFILHGDTEAHFCRPQEEVNWEEEVNFSSLFNGVCLSFPHGALLPAGFVLHVAFRKEYHLTLPTRDTNTLPGLAPRVAGCVSSHYFYFASAISLCAHDLMADLVQMLSEGEQEDEIYC